MAAEGRCGYFVAWRYDDAAAASKTALCRLASPLPSEAVEPSSQIAHAA